jgi:hypothetical protein
MVAISDKNSETKAARQKRGRFAPAFYVTDSSGQLDLRGRNVVSRGKAPSLDD